MVQYMPNLSISLSEKEIKTLDTLSLATRYNKSLFISLLLSFIQIPEISELFRKYLIKKGINS